MNDSYNGHKVIVFAQEHYNPLGQIRSLGENGINPIYFSLKRNHEIAVYSKYISKLHRVNTLEEGYNTLLREYGDFDYDHRPYILFSDDKCISFMDNHYDELKDKFILFNASSAGHINHFMNKYNILQAAKECGFDILDSWLVKKGEIPENIQYPIITKGINPSTGGYKSDVFICENEKELMEAYKKIISSEVLIQKFIDKENEYALQGFSVNHGDNIFVATAIKFNYLIKGYYSPYMKVSVFDNKIIDKKLRLLMKKTGYEGIFEAEFLIDKDGKYYFLEINFRASAWNYTGSLAGMPLSYLWVKSMDRGNIDPHDYKKFDDFMCMSEAIDFGKRVDTGKISLIQWLFDFKQAKTFIFNEKDPEPFRAIINHWNDFK